MASKKKQGPAHNNKGNCLAVTRKCAECGPGDNCDVCHEHDSPRGECEDCPTCEACNEAERRAQKEQT